MDYRAGLRIVVIAVSLVLYGCASATSTTQSHPASACQFYAASTPAGQMAEVTLAGPDCAKTMQWVANETRAVWRSTEIVGGTEIAQIAKGPDIVRIYQTGNSTATMRLAGYLADDFEAAGWNPQVPTG